MSDETNGHEQPEPAREWGTSTGFDRWIRTLETLGWVAAVCGVVVVALMVRQRRRIAAAYPDVGDG